MGFYVPTNNDVKFPKACEQCYFYDGLLCCVLDTYIYDPENKHGECPLIEVPPHGDLIDADKLVELCDIMADKCDGIGVSIWHQFKTTVEWSPIVIPAEEGE